MYNLLSKLFNRYNLTQDTKRQKYNLIVEKSILNLKIRQEHVGAGLKRNKGENLLFTLRELQRVPHLHPGIER